MKFLNKLIRDEAGATAIEYGLIAALIAVAAITAMSAVGDEVGDTFTTVDTTLQDAQDNPGVGAD
ncbi:Flp family type IVb pilin [Qipengyuania sp. YIM B01966]|uniref:Flp family type IVb pilin n=1 Tax=Qipengyuania sp. YIM B01966 TaxID=2778646 RepID=UPI0018F72FC4|nr:Flp family type IVb pilin [Qipengyuania sp. YIM B01966]